MSEQDAASGVRLFGDPACLVGGVARRIGGPPRTLALLLFLVLRRGAPLERRSVAFTLWPDVSEEEAGANLRRHLHALIGTLPEGATWLTTTRVSVAWNIAANPLVDVAAFEAALDAGDDEAAVRLYTGPLCPAIDEEWAAFERERLAKRAQDAVDRLVARDRVADRQRAIEWARQGLRIDPWREATIRTLIDLRAAAGDPAGARREYHEFAARLRREYDVDPDAETIASYERVGADGPARPRLASSLPQELTPLIGRETEVASICELLARERLVTLKATGGVGKTRLALRAARELASRFSDGLAFVELAAVRDEASVAFAALDAIGAHVEGSDSPIEAFTAALGERAALLVFDNCEQVIVAVAKVAAAVLERCPQIRVLCTSRESLNISGERIVDVLPLAESAAVELFIARANAVAPRFVATTAARARIAQLAQRLDGIPLAIELAAARMRAMTLEELDRRLDDRFRLLAGGNRTAVARQQSLRALIEWSVQLLTADERVLFRRLSVFNGDFTSAMVDEICAAAPIQTDTIFDSLVGLVDKSLVLVEPSVAEQRYRLFDSTRAFAREELDGAQESAHVHAAHLAYFERRAEAARHGFEGENWPEQCTWISANHANFRAALEWSLAERNDVERGTRVATGLLEYWYNYGLHQPALAWLEVARESADALTAHTRAHLFAALGNAQYAVHSRALAEASLRVAVTLFEELEGAEIELAIARNNLALLLPADPEHVESKRELFAAALATYERMGNATQRMSTGINLASIELLSGNIVGANERLQGVVPQAYDAANEPLLYSAYFRVAAYATYLLGDVATARTQMAQSVDLARPFGETLTWAARLAFLGLCQWGCNEHVTALMNLAVSLRILGAAPFSPFAIQALFCYGRVLAETDDLRTAVILVAVAQRLTRERGSASPLGMHLTWLHDRARDALGEHGVADAVRAARDMTYEAALAAASSSLASAALVAHADGVAANIAAG